MELFHARFRNLANEICFLVALRETLEEVKVELEEAKVDAVASTDSTVNKSPSLEVGIGGNGKKTGDRRHVYIYISYLG